MSDLLLPLVFRVHCDARRRQFFVVEIHETEEKMRAAIRQFDGDPAGCPKKGFRALCLKYVKDQYDSRGRRRVSGELGTMFFRSSDCTPLVVAHEITHAAVWWAQRNRREALRRRGAEEAFCQAVHTMTEEFYHRAGALIFLNHATDEAELTAIANSRSHVFDQRQAA